MFIWRECSRRKYVRATWYGCGVFAYVWQVYSSAMGEQAPLDMGTEARITVLAEWRKELEAERAQQNRIIDAYRESDREQRERTERHNDFRRYVLEYLNEHWFSILREIRAEHSHLTALGIKRIWICPGPDSHTTDDDQMSTAVFELFRNIPRPLKESLPIYIQATKEFLQQKATAQHSSCPFLRLGVDDAGGLYAFWD